MLLSQSSRLCFPELPPSGGAVLCGAITAAGPPRLAAAAAFGAALLLAMSSRLFKSKSAGFDCGAPALQLLLAVVPLLPLALGFAGANTGAVNRGAAPAAYPAPPILCCGCDSKASRGSSWRLGSISSTLWGPAAGAGSNAGAAGTAAGRGKLLLLLLVWWLLLPGAIAAPALPLAPGWVLPGIGRRPPSRASKSSSRTLLGCPPA